MELSVCLSYYFDLVRPAFFCFLPQALLTVFWFVAIPLWCPYFVNLPQYPSLFQKICSIFENLIKVISTIFINLIHSSVLMLMRIYITGKLWIVSICFFSCVCSISLALAHSAKNLLIRVSTFCMLFWPTVFLMMSSALSKFRIATSNFLLAASITPRRLKAMARMLWLPGSFAAKVSQHSSAFSRAAVKLPWQAKALLVRLFAQIKWWMLIMSPSWSAKVSSMSIQCWA